MAPVVAVIAPGNMGAAIGGRLAASGLKVLTSLANRSAASAERAAAARLEPAGDQEIARADYLLSIVPPRHAIALAERLAPALTAANRKPVYVDCNAISPRSTSRIAEILEPMGVPFVEGGIMGGPPREGYSGPKIFVSGRQAQRVADDLSRYGLLVRAIAGGVGAASALKLSYAGINKGMIAIGAAMVLAARRAGVEPELMRELSDSQRALVAQLTRGVPDMFSKAERWAPEMREIADYAGVGGETDIFGGMADLYERLAADFSGSQDEIEALRDFFGRFNDKR
jgi:3-hydroxyisobutyrate dehydrogenase-like beta-hydroxyacid dehydrogenase